MRRLGLGVNTSTGSCSVISAIELQKHNTHLSDTLSASFDKPLKSTAHNLAFIKN
jgi:hypothetical protein